MLARELSLLIKFELKIIFQSIERIILPLIFVLISNCAFALAVEFKQDILQNYGPAFMVITLLLSSLLTIPQILSEDYQDGFLSQYLISFPEKNLFILAKIISHWLVSVVVILCSSFIVALLFGMSLIQSIILIVVLSLTCLIISTICCLSAILTLNYPHKIFLNSVITLPYTLCLIIPSVKAISMARLSVTELSPYLFLLALLLIFMPFTLFFGSVLLRER